MVTENGLKISLSENGQFGPKLRPLTKTLTNDTRKYQNDTLICVQCYHSSQILKKTSCADTFLENPSVSSNVIQN